MSVYVLETRSTAEQKDQRRPQISRIQQTKIPKFVWKTQKKMINLKEAAQCYEDILALTFPSRYKNFDITETLS